MRRKKFYLIDLSHNADNIRIMAIYETASKIFLYHGKDFSEQNICKYWPLPSIPPSWKTFSDTIKNPYVKWYINEKLNVSDGVWNGSFLAGMTEAGKLNISKTFYTSFFWYRNTEIAEMIKECPFYGKLLTKWNEKKGQNRWCIVPALSLKRDKTSISYLAGVLSVGRRIEINGESYVAYTWKLRELFLSFKIPIEGQWGRNKKMVLISPFWIALLTPWMPESRKKWLSVKKPYKAEEYAFILWRVFTGKDIEAGKLPYLPSRRTFYYRYHTIDNLERKWVEYQLVDLDARFKEVVQKWAENDLPKFV